MQGDQDLWQPDENITLLKVKQLEKLFKHQRGFTKNRTEWRVFLTKFTKAGS
jgi:hypothetical protein